MSETKEYIIRWNYGDGDQYELVEADSISSAEEMAYEAWREDAEDRADFEAMEATDELKEDYL